MAATVAAILCVWLSLLSSAHSVHGLSRWPGGSSTRFYEFKVQTKKVTKLCNTKDIVTINDMFPGPVVYAQEDDRVIVRLTNLTPYNATIHWHGVRQRLSCWFDGPSYITQCPIQAGQTFTYEFTLVQQKGTLLWHAHVSWLRATVYGAIVVYPKTGVPYPFPYPYEEHIIILGCLASGGGPPIADAYTMNGHPGPNYNCSGNDVYKIDVVPGKTYLLRLINAGLNNENFFGIANHKLTIVEADAEYTKPFTTDRVMLGPGQTLNVLVTANQPIGRYSMAMGPYMSGQNIPFQNITAVAYFQYLGATPNSLSLPAVLPSFNDNLAVKTVMDGLKGLNTSSVPKEIDKNLFVTIAYYRDKNGYFTEDFPGAPLKFYDFVNGAPNNAPNNTNSQNGTRVFVLEYGTRVQLILQDTGTVSTENHPIHLHGYSFYVVGYGTGNYNPDKATFNLVDPPYMNTIGVPVGGWAAIRFTADNPGVWFMHCHLEIHLSWGLSMAFIVKNGQGPLETLPHPPADYPRC
ncbi:UNVERIFIED_CONTAM: Laccase-6 [Sesamum radiatum]|uniref:laccase n=1 Tax=Sesamum radiatum TaxID=300843 RepID=A0AAW2VHA9_SESRA